MKKLLLAAAAVIGLSFMTTSNADAQMSAMTNCSVLSGTPMMCVKNNSSFPVVAIQASNGMVFGSDWISIPGGMIPPGGTTIVRFPTWGSGCMKFVVVKTSVGATHVFPGVDVCHSTTFPINGW